MFERLQKPFLTVETGEAYQPIRLTYQCNDSDKLLWKLSSFKCIEKNENGHWSWYWNHECEDIHFESIDTYQRSESHPVHLGTISFHDTLFHIDLTSFKRACLAVPFFHKVLETQGQVQYADFLNKVYGLGERLPHGFTELFNEKELKAILAKRLEEYKEVQAQCEHAETLDEAITILTTHTDREAHKKLPFAERYEFELKPSDDPDLIFLGFYIFLRSRELVAIRRWFGEAGYTLGNVVDEAIETVFGDVGLNIIE